MTLETYRRVISSEHTQGPPTTSKVSDGSLLNDCWISYGLPFQEAVAKHVKQTFGASRVYILASRTLADTTSALQDLEGALAGHIVGVKKGLKAHTSWNDVLVMKRECEEAKVDAIVTLGGGSLTDAAKLLSLILANDINEPAEFHKLDIMKSHSAQLTKEDVQLTANPPSVPVIIVSTTLSGGEYTIVTGATEDSTNLKYQILAGAAIQLVVLDAALVAHTTPSRLWISSGFRAIDHAVEAYVSPLANPATEKHALAALKQLIPSLLRVRADEAGVDVEARHLGQMGAIEAVASVGRVYTPVGASHAIGHMLGPWGVVHGETSAILLPAVCSYNAAHGANVERQRALADALRDIDGVSALAAKHGVEKDGKLSVLLRALTRELGLPASLKEVGIEADKVDKIAENSLHDPWMKTNPIPLLTKEQVLELLKPVTGY